MNREAFNESMKRVLAFTQAPKTPSDREHLTGYLNGLYEAVGSMDPYLFEKVTVELCKNMSRGQRPMPGQFWAICGRLRDEQRAGQPVKVCPSCKNTIWTMVRMMETKSGEERDFAKPCPECQIRHPFKDAPPRDGWIAVERKGPTHDEEMLQKAKTMSPGGARFVLDLAQKHKTNFSEEVLMELVLRSGDAPKQENHAVEAVLDSLTVVKGLAREAAPTGVAVGSPAPSKITVNGEEYEVEE